MKNLKRIVSFALAAGLALILSADAALAAAKPAPSGKVNVNAASAQQLTALPGVGEKLAARIVEYRQKSGGFKSVQELLNVKGIGEKNLAKIQTHVTLGEKGDKAEKAEPPKVSQGQ
jgi:competence protein ComEA